jgi:MIP family channel proteins
MISFQWGVDRSITGFFTSDGAPIKVLDMKAVGAEFVGMFIFVVFGCGAAVAHGAFDGETRLGVAFAFGMAIMVLAYAIGHHSGGHMNCAVTFSLVLGGQVPWYQGIANALAQLAASLCAAGLIAAMFPCHKDLTTNLGSNIVAPGYNPLRVLVAEAFGTFLLCFTVWETAVTPQTSSGKNACIAIGFAVFIAHLMLLPIDGCSINPTRSFGPAIVSFARGCENYTAGGLRDLWMMWIGPLLGAAGAAATQKPFAPEMDRLKKLEAAAKEYFAMQRTLEGPQESLLGEDDVKKGDGFDGVDGAEKQEQTEGSGLVSRTFGKCLSVI